MVEAALRQAVIVHTSRAELREIVEQECKELGAAEPRVVSERDACISMLANERDIPLVIDWTVGPNDCNAILGSDKRHHKIETRPIFLVTPEYSTEIFAIAMDYAVSQMHAGPISRPAIKECLLGIFNEDDETRAIKETLVQVAECRKRNEWPKASELIEGLLAKMPEQGRLLFELAEQKIYDKCWSDVAALMQPMIDKDPPNIRALHLYGRALMQQGDYDRAIENLQKAKIINPLNVDRLIDLGNAFLLNNQIENALSEFQSVKAIDPSNKEATIGESKCLLLDGEINEALQLLKAVSGPREIASIFNTAAILAMRRSEFEKGMTLYRSALAALGADDAIASRLHYNIGLGFRRWHKFEMAAKHLKLSTELDPTFEKAKSHLQRVIEILSGSHFCTDKAPATPEAQGSDVAVVANNASREQDPAKSPGTTDGTATDEVSPGIDWEQSA